jgi:hypothetical protein
VYRLDDDSICKDCENYIFDEVYIEETGEEYIIEECKKKIKEFEDADNKIEKCNCFKNM